jgi:hypothetical protein
MSDAYTSGCAGAPNRSESGDAVALREADWLCLAAAPTFVIMALLTGVPVGGQPDLLCSAAEPTSLLSGMIPMYLLMSAFHSPPWLKLISSRRKRPHTADRTHEGLCSGRSRNNSETMAFGLQHAGGEVKSRRQCKNE